MKKKLLAIATITLAVLALSLIQGIRNSRNEAVTQSLAATASTALPANCNADINQDLIVDLSDYSILAINFLSQRPTNPRADINSDGIVDLSDYSLLAVSFLRQATNCQQTATPTPSPTASPAGPAITLTSTPPTSVKVYEKYEVSFTINTAAKFTLFQYDTAPPPGVVPGTGITVDGLFTVGGATKTHPAFFMHDTAKIGSGSSMYFVETGPRRWVLRFSPQQTGTFAVALRATDASGTTTLPIGSFTATAPTKPGFIKVSQADTRYFEFSNGQLFWPIGPVVWDTGGSFNFAQYQNTGQNFSRPWIAGTGLYSGNWARWKSSAERHGNEGFATRVTATEKYPGADLSYEIFYPQGFRVWIASYLDNIQAGRFVAGRNYQIKLTYKLTNVAGPRVAGQPYGLVAKLHNSWSGLDLSPTDFDNSMRSAPRLFTHLASSDGWQTFQGQFTSNLSTSDLSLYLDNVTAGQAYVHEFSVREILSGGNLGGEIIRNPIADIHTYIEQRSAAFLDWQVTEGEKYGIYYKYVVHDKNDPIQNHLKADGTFATPWGAPGGGYYQAENTKARWLLRQYYRYLVARWGYSTAIHSWELNNEGPPNDDPAGSLSSPHWRTAQAFAKYMRQVNAHPQLATTSFWCCWRPKFWGNHTAFPDIDYADLHDYSGNSALIDAGGPIPNSYDVVGWTIDMSLLAYRDRVGKPLIRAESGISRPEDWWVGHPALTQPNPGLWYKHLIWAGLNPGAMFDPGYWFGEHLSQFDRRTISKPFFDFVSTLDLNQGGYQDLAAISTNSNLRVVGQRNLNRNSGHFWVQNRNTTWNSQASAQSGTITITVSPNRNLTLQTWNTATGALIQSASLTSNSAGQFQVPISDLITDVAYKFFPR